MIAYHLEAQRMMIFCEHLTLDRTCGAKQKTITLSINSGKLLNEQVLLRSEVSEVFFFYIADSI